MTQFTLGKNVRSGACGGCTLCRPKIPKSRQRCRRQDCCSQASGRNVDPSVAAMIGQLSLLACRIVSVCAAFDGSRRVMKLPPFDYACPATISEAVELLASRDGDAKALAGGQSLVPMLAFRLAQPALLVDLRKLAELRAIKISEHGVALGAMVRWRDIEDDARLATRASAAQGRDRACRALSDPQSRHGRRQHRACRSGGGNARHRGDLRGGDRRRRQVRCARDPGGRFLPGTADDCARGRRDHRGNPPAGLAGAPALGIPGIRPPPRRFCHGRRRAVLRPG